jgi:uncharacterized protein
VREGVTHTITPQEIEMSPIQNTAIPADILTEIDRRLEAIKADESVQLLMAVESGSRAWGFPSPDSDYDVRFVYLRKRDWYLSLSPGRDVIERPIVDEIDLNGWDIRKAIGLLLKSNAVISEWMESPIRYCEDHLIVEELRSLADGVLDGRALAFHYANLGRNAADRWLDGNDAVPVKKYFYALRPALAIQHVRLNSKVRPPMNLQELIAGCDLSPGLKADIDELVQAKSRTNERSNGTRRPDLDAFIRDELSRASDVPGRDRPDAAMLERANTLFLKLVNT